MILLKDCSDHTTSAHKLLKWFRKQPFPFFSHFIFDSLSSSHLSSHNSLLAVSLGFTLPDSHMIPSLPSALLSITVWSRETVYFNKMAIPYPNSQSFSNFLILLYFLPSTCHLLSCVFVYCMFSPFRIRVS